MLDTHSPMSGQYIYPDKDLIPFPLTSAKVNVFLLGGRGKIYFTICFSLISEPVLTELFKQKCSI